MDVLAHITAARDFLNGIRGSSCYKDVLKSQAACVTDMLDKAVLSMETAKDIVPLLNMCGWDQATVDGMTAKIGIACSRQAPGTNIIGQDFKAMVDYFMQREWDFLLGPGGSTDKLMVLAKRGRELGLKSSSETTAQTLTGMFLGASEGLDRALAQSPMEKFQAYNLVKATLKTHGAVQKGPSTLLRPDLYACAATWSSIYGTSRPVPCPFDPAKLQALVVSIPCRSSSKLLRPVVPPTTLAAYKPEDMMQTMMQTFMNAMGCTPPSKRPPLHLEFPPSRPKRAAIEYTPPSRANSALAAFDADDHSHFGVGEAPLSDGDASGAAAAVEAPSCDGAGALKSKPSVAAAAAEVLKAMAATKADKAAAEKAAGAAAKKAAGAAKKAKKGTDTDTDVSEADVGGLKKKKKTAKLSKAEAKAGGKPYYQLEGNTWVCYGVGGVKKKTFAHKAAGGLVVCRGPLLPGQHKI